MKDKENQYEFAARIALAKMAEATRLDFEG